MSLHEFEQAQLAARQKAEVKIPDFAPGDTVEVRLNIVEGERKRVQAFEGVCIARKGKGLRASFTVRKISHGEGVERIFPLHSPSIAEIKLVRRGRVRRAKLYYLRALRGRAARIQEKQDQRKPVKPATKE